MANNNELFEYKFFTIEKEIAHIIEASHEMTKTISSLVIQLGTVNENIKRILDVSNKITERIIILESDFQERAIRKKIYKSLIKFYPVILSILMIAVGIDHEKIVNILSSLKIISPKLF